MYEIQAEYIPGNNQLWISLKTESDDFMYWYDTLEAAEMMLPGVRSNFPEGTTLRIIEKITKDENTI
jgi:hypothetical protein